MALLLDLCDNAEPAIFLDGDQTFLSPWEASKSTVNPWLAALVAIFDTWTIPYARGLWSAFDRLEFSSTSVLLGELVAIMLEKREVGFPL